MRHPARAAVMVLAAIGTATGAATASASTGSSTPAASVAPRCTTAALSVALKPGSPGAGQRYATVVLTNAAARPCTVRGYGGLALLGAPGQGVPTDLRRAGPVPAPVVLHRGQSARSLLHWTVVPGPGEDGAVCEPTATTVVLTPPDQRTAALLAWTGGAVCQHGRIDQNAYVPGSAPL
jgi:Protein of unknown function (DUF4232)